MAAGGVGDTKIGGQEGPSELVTERGVTAREATSDCVTQTKGFPRDVEGVEAVVIEGAGLSLHDDVVGADDVALRERTAPRLARSP